MVKKAGHRLRDPASKPPLAVGASLRYIQYGAAGPLRLLTSVRVKTRGALGNKIHIITPWTLWIQKMYMGTLGYEVQISL